jgi:hypothetical protein
MVDDSRTIVAAMSASILLVTSFDWTRAERLAGAFAGAGARVDALYPAGHTLAVSRHLRRGFGYRALSPLAAIRRAIEAADPDLVVPCDDRICGQLVALHGAADGRLRKVIARSLGQPALYPALSRRRAFIADAIAAGVPGVEMFDVPTLATLDEMLRTADFPLVLKSDHSWGGAGVAVAADPEAARQAFARLGRTPSRLREVLRAAKRRDSHFLHGALSPQTPAISLQRFIPGVPVTSSIACWQGAVVAANHFEALVTQSANGPASVVAPVRDARLDDYANRIARRFGLSGLHGLDYIRDAAGGLHLLEINPRATPTAHLNFGAGHDLCGALLDAMGHHATPQLAIAAGPVALFPQEAARDPASPWLERAFHDVPWDDPAAVRACVRCAPAEARARLESVFAAPLTTKIAVFGA